MLYLNSNTASVVTTTLYEKCKNIINPYFTWKLTNLESNQSLIVYADTFSDVQYYYNQFTFSVVNIPSNQYATGSNNGIIYANEGVYKYEVFEMATASTDITSSLGLVECGLLTINGTYSSYVVNHENDSRAIFVNKRLDY